MSLTLRTAAAAFIIMFIAASSVGIAGDEMVASRLGEMMVILVSLVAIAGSSSLRVAVASDGWLYRLSAVFALPIQGSFLPGLFLAMSGIFNARCRQEIGEIAAIRIDKLTFNPHSDPWLQWQSVPTWADILYQTNRRKAAIGERLTQAFPSDPFLSKDIKVFPSSKRRVSNDS